MAYMMLNSPIVRTYMSTGPPRTLTTYDQHGLATKVNTELIRTAVRSGATVANKRL